MILDLHFDKLDGTMIGKHHKLIVLGEVHQVIQQLQMQLEQQKFEENDLVLQGGTFQVLRTGKICVTMFYELLVQMVWLMTQEFLAY
jgi:hypothetical protein